MLDRRHLLQGSAVLAGLALPFARLGTARPFRVLPIYRVIFDANFPQGRQFGVAALRLGANVHAIHGDVTDLWHDDLHNRWRHAPAAIAGMTGFNSMFVLEMMAADVGMRVIYRADHRPYGGGLTAHHIFGPESLASHMRVEAADAGWPRKVAKAITSWPAEQTTVSKERSTIAEARSRAIGRETLVSWIIALPDRG
jgi:hypothetical protein